MGSNTKIEFAEHSWNPWYGCSRVSEGCDNCYAERWAKRAPFIENFFGGPKLSKRGIKFPRSKKHKEGDFVFVCSLTDFFHEQISPLWRAEALSIMADRPELIFLLLTKRIGNAAIDVEKFKQSDLSFWPKFENNRNVWLGVTAENQKRADERIPILLEMNWPGRKFVSIEPMLGPIDLTRIKVPEDKVCLTDHGYLDFHCNALAGHDDELYHQPPSTLDWVIVGAESGANRRRMDPDWARTLRDQCDEASVPFVLKQMEIDGQLVKSPCLDGHLHLDRPDRR